MQTLVQMKNVVKKFPGVTALNGISFEIKSGEVHVLLGENGAGKSTLMKILSGVQKPTSGTITLCGKTYQHLKPKEAAKFVSVIYQELSVINELSIAENMFVGSLPTTSFGTVDYKAMYKKANELSKKVGLKRDVKTLVENLSISEKQLVEIAKALASDSKVIVMDEPTASLTRRETRLLFKIVGQLKKDGKGIVFISHKLAEIIEIGDRVTVLKDGSYVGTKNISEITADDLVSMMVGRQVKKTWQHGTDPREFEKRPVVFEVENLSRKDKKAKNVSFKVRKGEILGFAGLVGSGRSELVSSIFAAEEKESGKIKIDGKEVKFKTPYGAIKNGLAMVTENRRETGFFPNLDIAQNIGIVSSVKSSKGGGLLGMIDFSLEQAMAQEQRKAMNIKCSSLKQSVSSLSGGNQQKVILGKWNAANSKVIIFDEPTKGIDVGAKSEIYALMRRLSDEGKGIIVVSSELPEILAVCDSIAVYKNGEIAKTFSIGEATEEKIIKAATAN